MYTSGLIIYTLGWGFDQSVQLWLTSRVDRAQIAVLYSTTSLVSAVGGLAEAPLLAFTFSAGLDMVGFGAGLPFLVAGGIFTVSSIGIWIAGG